MRGHDECVCMYVCNSVQERVGNGKVVSVGGRCGCEMKSCPFFLPYNPFPFSAPFLPSWLRLYSSLSPLFLTGLTVTECNCMKEKLVVNLHIQYLLHPFRYLIRILSVSPNCSTEKCNVTQQV